MFLKFNVILGVIGGSLRIFGILGIQGFLGGVKIGSILSIKIKQKIDFRASNQNFAKVKTN